MISLSGDMVAKGAGVLLVAALVAWIIMLRGDVSELRDDLSDSQATAKAYEAAAARAVADAAALSASRDAADSSYLDDLARIARAADACLDTALPNDLLDGSAP